MRFGSTGDDNSSSPSCLRAAAAADDDVAAAVLMSPWLLCTICDIISSGGFEWVSVKGSSTARSLRSESSNKQCNKQSDIGTRVAVHGRDEYSFIIVGHVLLTLFLWSSFSYRMSD